MLFLKRDVSEFIHQINDHDDIEELRDQFQAVISGFGYEHYIMATIPGVSPSSPGFIISTTWPTRWTSRYKQMGYYRYDTVLHYIFLTDRPYYWSEAKSLGSNKRIRAMARDAEEHGLTDGILFPLHNMNLGHHFVSLASSTARPVNISRMGALYLIASHFSAALSDRMPACLSSGLETLRDTSVHMTGCPPAFTPAPQP